MIASERTKLHVNDGKTEYTVVLRIKPSMVELYRKIIFLEEFMISNA